VVRVCTGCEIQKLCEEFKVLLCLLCLSVLVFLCFGFVCFVDEECEVCVLVIVFVSGLFFLIWK
jgi:hypothetical protein